MDGRGSEQVDGWMYVSGYSEGQASIWAGALGVVIFVTLCTLLLLGHMSFRNNSYAIARNAV